jgi:hypothetical protein
MTRTLVLLLSVASLATPASAATYIYMTGEESPWGISADDKGSPEAAMDLALGSGNWKSVFGFTTDVFKTASFVYLEGGDMAGLGKFLQSGGRDAVEAFVKGGGAVFVNAARNDSYDPLDVGFGFTLTGERFSEIGKLTDAGHKIGLDLEGAGSWWKGNYFSHDTVSCEPFACKGVSSFIEGTEGSVLMGGMIGKGYMLVGGMTSPYWQSESGMTLRANTISHAAAQASRLAVNGPSTPGVIPEPETWAMMILGFGMIGLAARRRRGNLARTSS